MRSVAPVPPPSGAAPLPGCGPSAPPSLKVSLFSPPPFPLQVLVFSFWVDVLLILGHALEANQVPYAFGKVGTCAEGVNILQSSQQRSDGPTALPLQKHSGSSRFLLGSSSVPYTLSEWHVAHADMH